LYAGKMIPNACKTIPQKDAAMFPSDRNLHCAVLLLLTFGALMLPPAAKAASCKTQSQMNAAERDALSNTARGILSEVQSGDVQSLRQNTTPAVAADFAGIASSVDALKPLVRQAVITVDALYVLDSSTDTPGAARTDFYCGTQVVVLNFTDLLPGTYALAIIHATGVPKPQQISLILSETAEHRWMLGGFFSKPIIEAGHDGLWYWVSARDYAQRGMKWDAWFYYRVAAYSLQPVDFLSSPNLEKLQHEADRVHPDKLPDTKPMMLAAHGSLFQVTLIDTTALFGSLDLEVHYVPDTAQTAELRDRLSARKQVTEVMMALLALHPELHDAFHGIWVQADQGSTSVFSLELPMDQIGPGIQPVATASSSIAQ
jgi:hypothetical protein